MKPLILFALVLLSIPSYCQDSAISFSEIVQIDNVSQSDLFNRARMWVNDNFKSGKDVIQISDKEAGQITGTGKLQADYTYHGLANKIYHAVYTFSFKILVKDWKYKCIFEDFNNTGFVGYENMGGLGLITSDTICHVKWPTSSRKQMNLILKSAKDNLTTRVNLLIASLKDSMNKKTAAETF